MTMKDNKLIAEFMGVNPTILGDEITYEMYGVIDCIEDGVDEQHFFLEEQLLFHTSWDWLMPVIYKVKSIDPDWVDEEAQHIIDEIDHALVCCWGMEDVYRYTVDAIMNYNEWKS